MLNVLWWFIAVEAIGLAAFPLAYYLLPKLSDRGFSLSKPLGILVVAYASWMLSVLHIVPSVRFTIAGLFLILAGLSGWYAWKKRVELKEFGQLEGLRVESSNFEFGWNEAELAELGGDQAIGNGLAKHRDRGRRRDQQREGHDRDRAESSLLGGAFVDQSF